MRNARTPALAATLALVVIGTGTAAAPAPQQAGTPSTYWVEITGPTAVKPGATCTWGSRVYGSSEPYGANHEYLWTSVADDGGNYTSHSYTATNAGGGFGIVLEVRDGWNWADDTRYITVSPNAPDC